MSEGDGLSGMLHWLKPARFVNGANSGRRHPEEGHNEKLREFFDCFGVSSFMVLRDGGVKPEKGEQTRTNNLFDANLVSSHIAACQLYRRKTSV